MATNELCFQRASVHLVHDAQRLQDGKDLNDSLLDFFVKLGQALIPERCAAGGPPPVAYLGSHFYDVLRKGEVADGRAGHKNVANWARRKLGRGGLFTDGVGALAVPVNEVLTNSAYGGPVQDTDEKHWWLALLLNPRGAANPSKSKNQEGEEHEEFSLLCLDSFVRMETGFKPAIKANRGGGEEEGNVVEVKALSRVGFNINVHFHADSDGSQGSVPEPKRSRLKAGGREFQNPEVELRSRDRGAKGIPGHLEGSAGFRLDRRGAAKTVGQYVFEFGDASDDYQPQLKLRMGEKPTAFQADVGRYLGGYLAQEYETSVGFLRGSGSKPVPAEEVATKLEEAMCLAGVPQQETSHDCGFFILEMILRALQLTAEELRELASASNVEVAMLPWPSQKQVLRRKQKLRETMSLLFEAANKRATPDVEMLLKAEPGLKARIKQLLLEGGQNFQHGFQRWSAGDWDLSPSPSRSASREKPRAREKEAPKQSREAPKRGRGEEKEARKKSRARSRSGRSRGGRRREDSRGREDSRKGRRRRRDDSSSESSRSRKRRRGRSSSSSGGKSSRSASPKKAPEPPKPSFTQKDVETMSVGKLKALCLELKVMSAAFIEKADFQKALAPFAAPAPKAAPAPVPAPAPAAKPAAKRSFTRSQLDTMSAKELRLLCIERLCLPNGPVEKGDLVQALAQFATPG